MENEWRQGDFLISTDATKLDLNLLHDFLSHQSYWAEGRTVEVIRRSIEHSLNFGIYEGEQQVGFGRVVTDYATFAWIADVFVIEGKRGLGLSKWLIDVMLSHPRLQGFRRWVLATKDAHDLYRRFGFHDLKRPERWMERPDPDMKESPDYWKANN